MRISETEFMAAEEALFIKEQIQSALMIDVSVASEYNVHRVAKHFIASFEALYDARDRGPDRPRMTERYLTWWDHFKATHMRGPVALGLVKPPAFERESAVIRMCPHIKVPDHEPHIRYMRWEK